MQVLVEYQEKLPLQEVIDEINRLPFPHVLLWYIGTNGLKKTGVKFYKDFIISPLLNDQSQATIWLVDLTAWGAFKSPHVKITKYSSFVEIIESFFDENIKCIKSSNIFYKMQLIDNEDIINYFKNALRREFIHKPSENASDKQIKIQDIFINDCPIISEWYNIDAAKAYSTFQYLEGCLLVNEIVTFNLKNNSKEEISIVFALPNDEIKYYRDETNAFRKDVEFLLNYQFSDTFNSTVRIIFLSFSMAMIYTIGPIILQEKSLKKKSFLAMMSSKGK